MENLILNKEQDGGYVLYVLDVEGNFVATIELKTAGDYAAALARFSDRILSDSGLPIVDIVDGKAAVVGHMTTEDFHREVLLPLAAEIKENAASDEEAVALVRASLTHPKILSLLARHHERKFLLHVWPDFDEILAGNLSATGNADTVGEVVPPGAPDADPGPDGAQTSQLDIRGSVPPGDSMRAGDPVLLSPGELILEETDLLLPGVGMDLEFSRTYRHRERRSGPFGRVWDHSFNLHLEEAVEYAADGGQRLVVYRSTGEMRWDRYVMHETGGIEHGRVREATFLPPAGAAEMLIKVGGRYRLVANDGKTIYYDERLRGESIEDRNGNRIRLFYEEAHLVRIVDTCSRRVTLRYDDGRLCEIRDEESRRWVRYEYDDAGRLNKVISSTGRVGQPERCHGYIYRGEDTPPGMRSNIVATWNPDGVEMLSVEYGDKLGTLAYNRVVAQEEAGGCWNYRYEPIVALTEDPNSEPHNIARLRVIVESPDGHLHEHEYNDMGRMVAYRFEVGTGVEARRIEHRFRYDHDGRVVREERPGGAVIDYVYRREIHAAVHGDPANAKPEEQLRFGELLKIVEHAAPRGNVPPQRITEFDYGEPARITKRTGPYYADAAGQLLPGEAAYIMEMDHDGNGNLVGIRYPDATLPDGTVQTGRRVTMVVDPRGRVERLEVAMNGQPDLVTQYVYDPEETRAAFVVEEILDPAGLAETRKFKWNAAGQLLRQLDPDGHEVHRSYDHFGRILSEERGPHALNAPPARTELSYTPTGAVREAFARRIGDDGAPDHAGSSVETTEYDRYGRPSRIEERSGDGSCVRTSLFRYDEAGRLAETVDPRGVKTRFEYDARGLVTKRTVAVGTPYQAVYRLRYSVDGQLAEAEGPLGNVQRFHYDGYSRVERTEEPGGTEETSAWDASDRLVQQSTHGRHPDAGPGTLLSELRQEYDEGGAASHSRPVRF